MALLLSYTLMFPAFIKLRQLQPEKKRPFKVSGNKLMINLVTWVPELLLIATIIMTIVPLNGSHAEITSKLPILIGTIITIILGEVIVRFAEKRAQRSVKKG